MITSENLSAVLSAVAWPVVALFIIFLLKSDIRRLCQRLRMANLPGGAEASFVDYGEASIDENPTQMPDGAPSDSKRQPTAPTQPPARQESVGPAVKWENSGNLFWIGHDLMWTVDVTLRGGPRNSIVHGLRQSRHHLRSLGLAGTPIESRLGQLESQVRGSLNQDWTASQRNVLSNDLTQIIRDIGDLAEAHQPGFMPRPAQ
jgi:hypothetical protein